MEKNDGSQSVVNSYLPCPTPPGSMKTIPFDLGSKEEEEEKVEEGGGGEEVEEEEEGGGGGEAMVVKEG
ncbi:hypothetical protein ElyMa_006166400 [Elysia marginata]|uniref:CTNNB1 binding N-teminal domain-containing protein n=1 Tax=Elysia marginata TaxID=1093978 RepID=A0AAV4H2V1_9GAST|nr:hypothetical protein ElyMa_006166400 [Elysia marginata]